jgi:sulfite reductase alpha subunit
MAKPMHETPNLDELETGPWPSFVTGLKRLAKDNDMMVDLMGQLETSYQTKFGYWKGGHGWCGRLRWWCYSPFHRAEG